MYNLPYFKDNDQEEVLRFMEAHSFVTLIGVGEDQQPVATQVPLLISKKDDQLVLRGHFMRQTDHHRAFVQHPEALVLFTGPHTYVSASWYENSQVASTWNYMTVQVKGKLEFLDNDSLLQVLTDTTAHFENDSTSPALVATMSQDYLDRMMKAIIAFRIDISSIAHVFKLSQNHNQQTYARIIDRLAPMGGDATLIAEEMLRRQEQLFNAAK